MSVLLDALDWIYIMIYGLLAVVVAVLIGYIATPFGRANLLRKITNRNYGVIGLRGRGGHTTFKMHDFNKRTYEFGSGEYKKAFVIDEEHIDRANGSVPLQYFNIDDVSALSLDKSKISPAEFIPTTNRRMPPENLNSIIMLIKALSEAGAALKQNKTFIICIGILVICLLILIVGWMGWQSAEAANNKLNFVMDALKIVVPTAQPFKLA